MPSAFLRLSGRSWFKRNGAFPPENLGCSVSCPCFYLYHFGRDQGSLAKRSWKVCRIFKESDPFNSPRRFNDAELIGRRRSQATTNSSPPQRIRARSGVGVRFSRIGQTNCVGNPAKPGCCSPTKLGRETSDVEEYKGRFIRSRRESPRSVPRSPLELPAYKRPPPSDKKPPVRDGVFLFQ